MLVLLLLHHCQTLHKLWHTLQQLIHRLLVLLLDRCAGLVCDETAVSCEDGGHTVGRVIASLDAIRSQAAAASSSGSPRMG